MQTLAEMKRHLATPDATLAMTNYELLRDGEWVSTPPRHSGPRKVAKLQTNAVSLYTDGTRSGVSWLYFGKASDWGFSGKIAVYTDRTIRMTYEVN
jgi:hypothetical protein